MQKTQKMSLTTLLLLLIVFYSLFAFKRIKALFLPYLNGAPLNNLIIIIPIFVFCVFLFYKKRYKHDKTIVTIFVLLLLLSLLSALNFTDINQSIYALFLFFVPFLLFFCIGENEYKAYDKIVTILILFSTAYSALTIFASFNYGTLLAKIGMATIDEQYNSQYRASLMLGSGITVSYFLNATLPLMFLKVYATNKNRIKAMYVVSIILNVVATLVENSRLAVVSTLVIVLFCSFFFKKQNFKNLWKKVLIVLASGIVLLIIINRIDVSRLFMGFKDTSTSERMDAFKLGIHIFEQSPLFGKGIGTYYFRAWSEQRYIRVDGITGLIDPHNTQAMLLAEVGLVGTALFYLFLFYLFLRFLRINNNLVKKTAVMFLISYLLGSLGGTQLITEISYSSIIWIMMGLFYGYYYGEKKESIGRYLSRYKYGS